MKVIIHIGATKTGSSALQHYLHKNSSRLAQDGVCYPNVGIASGAQHLIAAALHPSAFRMHSNDLPDPLPERLVRFRGMMTQALAAARSTNAHTLLLSSEYLWGEFPDSFFASWMESLAGCDVSIYAVLRRPDQWLQSSYLQALKSGQDRDFGPWLDAILESSRGANYASVLKGWKTGIGDGEIHLCSYEDQLARNAVFSDILKFVGVSKKRVPAPPAGRINPSPSEDAMKLMLEVNKSNLPDSTKGKVRQMIMAMMPQREVGTPLNFLDAAMRARIDAYYNPIVTEVIDTFCVEKTGFMSKYRSGAFES
ncbi:histidine kinase [Breoghania sp. L-A4]|uniref:histidine kinase n=1 Tax=Breoghania sp. L-A4 TaxID=2304600 RepID=UPI0013C309EF|nr:histidine kinase [Breoghania sp. L-A4]